MARRKLHRYTGNEVASQPSIAEQLLRGTKIGNWLYGEPKTYTDGNNAKRQDATFKESANGQMVQRMGETAKDAGNLAITGLAFGNPLTASNAMAPLIAGSQAYWIGHGIQDGAQRIENIGEGVKNFVEDPSWQNAKEVAEEVPMLALDVAGAVPVARTVATTAEQIAPTVRNAANKASNYLKKQYASHSGAKIINSEVDQFPKQKWLLDGYNDHDFIFNEFTDPNSVVHVTPNPLVGKNVTEKASHVSGTSWVPGSAERSLVEGKNMIWLWDGKPYRAQWNDQTFISIPKTNTMAQTRQSGAIGVPKIDLTAPTTKIMTRNPITGGFERQIVVSRPEPITPVKTHYRFFERPSTYFKDATYAGTPGTYAGKEVPTWQLPKGQRNQPYVKGYRAMYPEDVVVNFEKEKNTILNLFNSKAYRDRLLADGYTPEQIDDFVRTRIPIKRLKTATAAQSNKLDIGDAGEAFGDYIWLDPKIGDAEVALHEFGHISEWPGMWRSTIQPKITTVEAPYFDSKYYLSPGEVRTRALGVLQWMDETGGSIDDFYKTAKFGTNRRASQFRFAYPEDQGRNYLLHFWQIGGKINPKNN